MKVRHARPVLGVAVMAVLFALAVTACDTGDYHYRFVVGSHGLILATTDAGATWTTQPSGTLEDLNGVAFVSTTVGCAVGNDGAVLTTSDGSTWTASTNVPTARDLKAV